MEASGVQLWHHDVHINRFAFCQFPWLTQRHTLEDNCWVLLILLTVFTHSSLSEWKAIRMRRKTGNSCLGLVSLEDPVGIFGFQMAGHFRKPSSQNKIHAWTFTLAGDFSCFFKLILLTMQTWPSQSGNNWEIWRVGWLVFPWKFEHRWFPSDE